MISSVSQAVTKAPHPGQSRWNALNKVSNARAKEKRQKNKRRRSYSDGSIAGEYRIERNLAYSSVSWEDVYGIFNPIRYTQRTEKMDESLLDFLMNYLSIMDRITGAVYEGSESKRLHFIFPVLAMVRSAVKDVEILCEHGVEGENIHVYSRFEFVLKSESSCWHRESQET